MALIIGIDGLLASRGVGLGLAGLVLAGIFAHDAVLDVLMGLLSPLADGQHWANNALIL